MKIAVIGFGQCGGRIADEFARLNGRAHRERGIEIVTGAFAVNTDVADLSGLSAVRSDYQHRILIGGRKTGGHGVGKINEAAAEIARADSDKIVDAIRSTSRFYESDAFLVIASTSGGTGSGSIPVMTRILKERYGDKPVYALLILPFEHEEQSEARTIYNTAVCLKSVSPIADATIVVDNQRYVKKDSTIASNISRINQLIAEPFYDLLCAGEEKKVKHIGARLLDAGDTMQTLSGWTVVGYGRSHLPVIRLPFKRTDNFREKGTETHKGIQAMDSAISELSLECNPQDASRALYLLSAPAREMNMDLVKELTDYLKDLAPNSIIRYGDYPRGGTTLTVTVILSQLKNVAKVRKYYDQFPEALEKKRMIEEDMEAGLRELMDAPVNIPTLA